MNEFFRNPLGLPGPNPISPDPFQINLPQPPGHSPYGPSLQLPGYGLPQVDWGPGASLLPPHPWPPPGGPGAPGMIGP